MIELARTQVQLAAPASDVFAFVSDLRNFGQWFPEVLEITAQHASGEPGLSAHYRERVRLLMGRERTVDIRVVEFECEKRLVTEGNLQPVRPRMEIEVYLRAQGCELHWNMYSRNGGWAMRLLAPLAGRMMQSRAERAMQQLATRFGSLPAAH